MSLAHAAVTAGLAGACIGFYLGWIIRVLLHESNRNSRPRG